MKVEGLKQHQSAIDKLLVTQSGVVSVSIDIRSDKLTIYSSVFTRETAQPLLTLLTSRGYVASLADVPSTSENVNTGNQKTGYLNASGDKAGATTGTTGSKAPSLALAVYQQANQDSSLAARVARKNIQQKQQQEEQKSIIGRITSLFW